MDYIDIGTKAFAVVGALWGLAKVIAPLTNTKIDDKVAGALGKVHGVLAKVLGLKA